MGSRSFYAATVGKFLPVVSCRWCKNLAFFAARGGKGWVAHARSDRSAKSGGLM